MSGEGLPPVNPEVAAPTVGAAPGEALPSQVPVVDEVSVLEVELQSLQMAMLDAAKLKGVKGEVTILEDVTESDDPTVLAKQQLKVISSLHNICAKQFFAHETSLKSQMLARNVHETCTRLLLHRLGMVHFELQRLATHVEKDLELGSSTMDHVQESIQNFGDKFGSLSDTLKDIVSTHRARSSTEEEMRKKLLSEVGAAKEYLQHVRSNMQNITKAIQNLMWEVQEMRCGGKEAANGQVSNHGGSLLALMSVTIENQGTLILEHLNKMGLEIKDAVEKGVDPSMSLKRKREEQDQEEFQKAKAELERRKKEEEDKRLMEQTVLVTHPYTGEQMLLNYNQRVQFFQDLQHIRARRRAQEKAAWGLQRLRFHLLAFLPYASAHGLWSVWNSWYASSADCTIKSAGIEWKSREHGSWLISLWWT